MKSAVGRPNFVFIMADDLGYADLGCYGGRAPVSPHLDRMAAEGVRFTEAYANSPVCSPTRFALMTGRYQYRLRGAAEEPLTSKFRGSAELGLSPEHPTLPSLLCDAGYHTTLVGKWHLGFAPHFGPLKSGYREFFGAMGGGLDYFTHRDSNGIHDLYDGDIETYQIGYLTDLISDRAVRSIEASAARQQPFLLSVHYTAPHWPWETREDEAESNRIEGALAHTDGGSVQTYQTMIHHMDEGVGRILAALREQGLDENTIVVFTSDNGAERFSDTWPLIGKKMDLLEGGIRVPLLVRWPGCIAAGYVSSQVTITMDWVATFLEWAGVAPHPDYPLDGKSMCAHFDAIDQPTPRALYWRMKHRNQQALRDGDWKFLSIEGNDYLFNLVQDARERANLARRHPERLAQMRAAYTSWCETMPGIPKDALSVVPYTLKDMP